MAAAAGADAAAEALYGPCSAILLQNCSKNTWNYKPCQFSSVQFSVQHKTACKTAQIMTNFAGWRAGLLLLLLLMLLLKPYMALVALYCCIVTLYSFILAQLKPYMALVALYCCIVALYIASF